MKAFRKLAAGSSGLVDVPAPRPGPGQVLVQVRACGICGSDLHALRDDPGFEWVAAPVTMGHELAGEVLAVGAGVTDLAAGQGVVAVSIQGCGRCPVCEAGPTHLCERRRVIGLSYDGGLAEQVVVPRRWLVPVPDRLDLVSAAVAEPLSVAVHAVLGRSRIRPGDVVVVSGPGPIGLLSARLAALSGAQVLLLGTAADAQQRLPVAAAMGIATAQADDDAAQTAADVLGGRPVDTWVEASGAVPALAAALHGVRRGGQVTVVAMFSRSVELDPTAAVRSELTLAFSYASAAPDYVVALGLLAGGSVDAGPLVTRFPLSAAPEAVAAAGRADVVKALLLPG